MTDMPAPAPDRPLGQLLRDMYERGDLDAIEALRQQIVDENGNTDRVSQKLARFDTVRAEAYVRYQADHEMPEKDRIKAARANTKAANDRSPASDELVDLYKPVRVETTLSPDGSFVEQVKLTKWELDPDSGRPHRVEIEEGEI